MNEAPTIALDLTHPFAWVHVFTVMACPLDEAHRTSTVAQWSARAIGELDKRHDLDPDRSVRSLIWDIMTEPAGGIGAVSERRPTDYVDDMRAVLSGPGKLVGNALCLVAQAALFHERKVASLNRAWAILDSQRDRYAGYLPSGSNQFFERVWSKWRSVAHLHAAFRVSQTYHSALRKAGTPIDPWSHDSLYEMMSWAEWLRLWAIDFKPLGSDSPLLSEAESLRIISCVQPYQPPLAPLRSESLEAAMSHRATYKKSTAITRIITHM